MASIWGRTPVKPVISNVLEDYPVAKSGIVVGDKITKINGNKVRSWDAAQILLYYKNSKNYYTFEVEHKNKTKDTYKITPLKEKDENTKEERNVFGFSIGGTYDNGGFFKNIKYSFQKFSGVIDSMLLTLKGLFTGKISLNALSGPVGIYKVVDEGKKAGISSIIYIIAFLSMNVGLINILPFPAFDGGRVLFLLIEKIKGSAVNSKIENTFHTVGFILLIILLIYITYRDILKIFVK